MAFTTLPAWAEQNPNQEGPAATENDPNRLGRSPPQNFRNVEIQEEIGLWWNGEVIPGVLFLAGKSGSASPDASFTLVPGTAAILQRLLREMGIEENIAREWSEQKAFTYDAHPCLLLDTRENCAEMRLVTELHDGKKYLALKTDDALTARYGRIQGFSLIGSSQFSLGTTHTSVSDGRYLGASTRGITSRGRMTYEYDLSYTYSSSASNSGGMATDSSSMRIANYRLFAAGLGFEDGGRAYAGTFPAAYGNFNSDGGAQFFSHPALVGLAYRSKGARLSNFGTTRKIRLMLPVDSQVRILSGGVELFSGTVPAGDQTIQFQGYPEPFVDVTIRSATGLIRTERVEVLDSAASDSPADSRETGSNTDAGEFYIDAGRLIDASNTQTTKFKPISTPQASIYYTRWIGQYALGAGAQLIADRRRLSSTLTGPFNRWRVTAMAGNNGETGLSANLSSLEYGPASVSFNATRYRPPNNAIGTIPFFDNVISTNNPCQASSNSLCFQNTRYDSFGFSVGYRGLPFRLGYMEFSTPLVKYASVNLTGTHNLDFFGHPLILIGYISHDLKRKITSVSISLSVLLDSRQTLVSGLTKVKNGSTGLSTSYARAADPQSEDLIRNLNLSSSTSSPGGETNTSAYALSQWGPINNTTGISTFGSSGYGISSTIAVGYVANNDGLAYSNTGYASIPTGMYNSQGSAAIALVNESFDSQTFTMGDSVYAVEPRSSRLVDRSPGGLGKWSVSPGPAQEVLQPVRQLGRGEVAMFKVLSGFWAQAIFRDRALNESITARFSYKAAGGAPVRLYPDSRLRTLIYETVDSDDEIIRFVVDNSQRLWRCSARAPQIDLLNNSAYSSLEYQCDISTGQ